MVDDSSGHPGAQHATEHVTSDPERCPPRVPRAAGHPVRRPARGRAPRRLGAGHRLPRPDRLQRRRHHLPPARLLGPHGARRAQRPRGVRLRHAAALLVPRHPRPEDRQEAARRRHLAAEHPHRHRDPARPRRRRPRADHAHERRHHRLRVHVHRRDRRPAPGRPGRVRASPSGATSATSRAPSPRCRGSGHGRRRRRGRAVRRRRAGHAPPAAHAPPDLPTAARERRTACSASLTRADDPARESPLTASAGRRRSNPPHPNLSGHRTARVRRLWKAGGPRAAPPTVQAPPGEALRSHDRAGRAAVRRPLPCPPGTGAASRPTADPSPSLRDLEPRAPFAGRHIGPSPDEQAKMLAVARHGSLEELADAAVPEAIRATERLRARRRAVRAGGARRAARARRPEPRDRPDDRPGLRRHAHPAGRPAQRPGEPGLVHRLHALPAGDQPGPARGAAELPDGRHRPDRARRRRRVAARRGHRRGRGDDAGPAQQQGRRPARAFVVDADCHPQTIAVVQTRAAPLGIEVAASSTWPTGCPTATSSACCCSTPAAAGAVRDLRPVLAGRPRARRPGRRRRRPAGPDAAREPRRARRRRRRRQQPALRRAARLRRPARRLPRRPQGPGAHAARPPGRRQRRRRRRPGVPAGAADPRAAHPPREGDEQHLHRAGAARRHGRHVRRLPRPRRPARHRAAAPHRYAAAARRRPARRRPRGRARAASSTRSPSACPAGPRRSSPPRPQRGIDLRLVDDDTVGVSTDETTTRAHLDVVVAAFGAARRRLGRRSTPPPRTRCPPSCCATTPYLTHPVFSEHRSETALLRYLRRLSDKDLALDRTMIPLGSCTMKLNATTEMEPVTWPEFGGLHPFTPRENARGYRAADRRPRALAVRDHRLRRGEPAAQRRQPGRVRRAAGDPRLPPGERPGRARRLPDPGQRPRHQRRQRGHGRHAGGRRGHRADRRRRRRRPARQDRRSTATGWRR